MKPSPQHLKKTSRSAAHSAPVRLSAMFGCSVLLFGLSLTTVGFLAPTAASADTASCSAPTGTGLQKNIDTTEGCDNSEGTSLMTGYISDTGLSAGQSVTLEDGYEGLSSHNFYFGTYVLDLVCTTGTVSALESTYVVEEGTGSFPDTPPTVTSGTLPVVTADSSGDFVCAYTLSVEFAPSGQLNSSKNEVWTLVDGVPTAQTATPVSVKPPVLTTPPPPTTVPATSTTSTTVAATTTTSTTITPTSSTNPAESTTTTVAATTTTAPASTTTAPGSSTTIAPASTSAPAATTAAPADGTTHALAFTGSDTRGLVIGGFALMALGGLIVRASRRGLRSNG